VPKDATRDPNSAYNVIASQYEDLMKLAEEDPKAAVEEVLKIIENLPGIKPRSKLYFKRNLEQALETGSFASVRGDPAKAVQQVITSHLLAAMGMRAEPWARRASPYRAEDINTTAHFIDEGISLAPLLAKIIRIANRHGFEVRPIVVQKDDNEYEVEVRTGDSEGSGEEADVPDAPRYQRVCPYCGYRIDGEGPCPRCGSEITEALNPDSPYNIIVSQYEDLMKLAEEDPKAAVEEVLKIIENLPGIKPKSKLYFKRNLEQALETGSFAGIRGDPAKAVQQVITSHLLAAMGMRAEPWARRASPYRGRFEDVDANGGAINEDVAMLTKVIEIAEQRGLKVCPIGSCNVSSYCCPYCESVVYCDGEIPTEDWCPQCGGKITESMRRRMDEGRLPPVSSALVPQNVKPSVWYKIYTEDAQHRWSGDVGLLYTLSPDGFILSATPTNDISSDLPPDEVISILKSKLS